MENYLILVINSIILAKKDQNLVSSETFRFGTSFEYPNLSTELWKISVPVPVLIPQYHTITSTGTENGQYRT